MNDEEYSVTPYNYPTIVPGTYNYPTIVPKSSYFTDTSHLSASNISASNSFVVTHETNELKDEISDLRAIIQKLQSEIETLKNGHVKKNSEQTKWRNIDE